MLDEELATFALRTRAIALSVATTGSTSLSANATGFARASGSFLADGFAAGQEILPSGFPDNTRRMITQVTAQQMTIDGGLSVVGAAAGRTLVCGLPGLRSWENEQQIELDVKRPYVTDAFRPATSEVYTFPANTGTVLETGLYVLTLYALPKVGILAIRRYVKGIKALFAPGTAIAVGSDTLRMPVRKGVSSSEIIPTVSWSVVAITIPWEARTTNTVTA